MLGHLSKSINKFFIIIIFSIMPYLVIAEEKNSNYI